MSSKNILTDKNMYVDKMTGGIHTKQRILEDSIRPTYMSGVTELYF